MAADQCGGNPDHGGVARVVEEHPKVNRSFKRKKKNLKTLGRSWIQVWGRQIEAANRPSEVELVETLNPDKAFNEASLASDEASLASEEARKGGGRRKRGIRGKRGRGAWE
jgi:hypothetical protein